MINSQSDWQIWPRSSCNTGVVSLSAVGTVAVSVEDGIWSMLLDSSSKSSFIISSILPDFKVGLVIFFTLALLIVTFLLTGPFFRSPFFDAGTVWQSVAIFVLRLLSIVRKLSVTSGAESRSEKRMDALLLFG